MALRDKLHDRVQPLLEPGEQIQEIFLAQTGPSPWLGAATTLIWFAVKRRIVVVTDRHIVVVRAGYWSGTSAQEVIARLPRNTRLGPVKGLWAKVQLGPETVHVHKRFHGDIARADSYVASRPATAATLPPPSYAQAR